MAELPSLSSFPLLKTRGGAILCDSEDSALHASEKTAAEFGRHREGSPKWHKFCQKLQLAARDTLGGAVRKSIKDRRGRNTCRDPKDTRRKTGNNIFFPALFKADDMKAFLTDLTLLSNRERRLWKYLRWHQTQGKVTVRQVLCEWANPFSGLVGEETRKGKAGGRDVRRGTKRELDEDEHEQRRRLTLKWGRKRDGKLLLL
ncbi:hypothetical protein B0H19DRAFT_1079612 [Mycena capillaripes]|nr:hypothetical protein B0H19DRAFT_1079612 [Mycena capillaripes]